MELTESINKSRHFEITEDNQVVIAGWEIPLKEIQKVTAWQEIEKEKYCIFIETAEMAYKIAYDYDDSYKWQDHYYKLRREVN